MSVRDSEYLQEVFDASEEISQLLYEIDGCHTAIDTLIAAANGRDSLGAVNGLLAASRRLVAEASKITEKLARGSHES